MQFQLRAAERSALLAALRRLKTGRYAKEPPPTSAVPLRLRLDEGALASCTSYDQLLDAARDTIYAPVLRHLRPSRDGALPTSPWRRPPCAPPTSPTSTASSTVSTPAAPRRYFSAPWGSRSTCSTSSMCSASRPTSPRRSRRPICAFSSPFTTASTPTSPAPSAPPPAWTTSSPCCGTPPTGTASTAWRWARWRSTTNGHLPLQQASARRRAPSIYTAVAYLELKELELSVLINVIESVKYGVPYRAELADLVGQ